MLWKVFAAWANGAQLPRCATEGPKLQHLYRQIFGHISLIFEAERTGSVTTSQVSLATMSFGSHYFHVVKINYICALVPP